MEAKNIDDNNTYNQKSKILEDELNRLKIEQENIKLMSELINLNKLLLNKIENLEKSNNEIIEKINSLQTKNTTNFNEPLKTLGPRLQQTNPET